MSLIQELGEVGPGFDNRGVVFTQPWVVDLVLDLSGYVPSANLVDAIAIEPAAGSGNFLAAMVKRLIESSKQYGKRLEDCVNSLVGYELDPRIADNARQAVLNVLHEHSVPPEQAEFLAQSWIRVRDFLLEPPNCGSADFVVGNPPYVRLEHLDVAVAEMYRRRFHTMVGRTNLYIPFFEAALKKLRPGGVCAFICADRWMLNQQGAQLRNMITSGYSVEASVEMHRADAFETRVSAYPAITVIRRASQGPAVVATINGRVEPPDVPKVVRTIRTVQKGCTPPAAPPGLQVSRTVDWHRSAEPWTRTSPEITSLLNRLEAQFEPLVSARTGTTVGIGLATGADDVFITTDSQIVESCRLLPLALTRDTATGKYIWSGHYLVNPWDDQGLVSLQDYPRLRLYYESHQAQLQDRYVARNDPARWYRTIDRVNRQVFSEPKLYIPDIRERCNPVLDAGLTYPHHNLYVLRSKCWDLEALGGLLLSSVVDLFIRLYSVKVRGGYLRFQSQYLKRIRVPQPTQIAGCDSEMFVEAFRTRDRELATQAALKVYGISRLPEIR